MQRNGWQNVCMDEKRCEDGCMGLWGIEIAENGEADGGDMRGC